MENLKYIAELLETVQAKIEVEQESRRAHFTFYEHQNINGAIRCIGKAHTTINNLIE